MRHLPQALESLDEEVDLDHALDALVSVIHDATSKSFPMTLSSGRVSVGTMPQNPWFDDECKGENSVMSSLIVSYGLWPSVVTSGA